MRLSQVRGQRHTQEKKALSHHVHATRLSSLGSEFQFGHNAAPYSLSLR